MAVRRSHRPVAPTPHARRALARPREQALPQRELTLPERQSFNKERPPRPLGVAPGTAWEPRHAVRNHATNNIVVRFVEFIEEKPEWQRIGASLVKAYHNIFVRDDGEAGKQVPEEQGSWKFSVIGDYGAGTPEQARVAANIKSGNPELVVTVGDNVYPTGRWQDYERHFDPSKYFGDYIHKVPFMPSLGNHDLYRDDLRPYFGHFPHLEGRTYYAYNFKNAHFMSLDGDQDLRPGSAQRKWLEGELKKSKATYRVIYMHYPMYGRDLGEYQEIRESLAPLLKKYKVQLSLSGHQHNYQRSLPINGTTHILSGGGGQQVFDFAQKKEDFVAFRRGTWQHVEFSVGPNYMVARCIDENGTLIDTAVIPANPLTDAAEGAQRVQPKAKARKRAQ